MTSLGAAAPGITDEQKHAITADIEKLAKSATWQKTLADKGINIQVISTSEIKTSVLVGAEYTELAVRALHSAYGLDSEG